MEEIKSGTIDRDSKQRDKAGDDDASKGNTRGKGSARSASRLGTQSSKSPAEVFDHASRSVERWDNNSPEKLAVRELLALGDNLAREKEEAAQQLDSLQAELAEAQRRAALAESKAEEAAREAAAERRRRSETDERLVQEAEHMRSELEALRTFSEERLRKLGVDVASVSEPANAEPSDDPSNGEPSENEADGEPSENPADGEPSKKPNPSQGSGGRVSLNNAGFDELRYLGMSMTQAKRVLRFRENRPLTSTDDLHLIPGFSREYLTSIRGRIVL